MNFLHTTFTYNINNDVCKKEDIYIKRDISSCLVLIEESDL